MPTKTQLTLTLFEDAGQRQPFKNPILELPRPITANFGIQKDECPVFEVDGFDPKQIPFDIHGEALKIMTREKEES